MITKIITFVINTILPPKCEKCQIIVKNNGSLCEKCWLKVVFIDEPMCEKCGYPFQFSISKNNTLCGKCLDENNKYHFDFARSVCKYDGFIKDIIIKMKYNDSTRVSLFIANAIYNKFSRLISQNETIIIPVPMDKKSLRIRTYNQTALIAKRIAKKCNITYNPFIMQKTKYTGKQVFLDREKREKNLKNAFKIDKKQIQNLTGIKRIVIIDDVFTTGATLNEIAKMLKKHTNAEIIAISFARTVIN